MSEREKKLALIQSLHFFLPYMQSPSELPIAAHLDVNLLVQAQPDQVQGLLDGGALHQPSRVEFNSKRDRGEKRRN